jgi:hypothetical protein
MGEAIESERKRLNDFLAEQTAALEATKECARGSTRQCVPLGVSPCLAGYGPETK